MLVVSFQNPEDAVKEFMEDKPILSEIEQQIKYYQVSVVHRVECHLVSPSSDDKISALSKLKAFADEKTSK